MSGRQGCTIVSLLMIHIPLQKKNRLTSSRQQKSDKMCGPRSRKQIRNTIITTGHQLCNTQTIYMEHDIQDVFPADPRRATHSRPNLASPHLRDQYGTTDVRVSYSPSSQERIPLDINELNYFLAKENSLKRILGLIKDEPNLSRRESAAVEPADLSSIKRGIALILEHEQGNKHNDPLSNPSQGRQTTFELSAFSESRIMVRA